MASTAPRNGTPPIDEAFRRLEDLNERFLTASRKAGNLYVDSYEQAVKRGIELERHVAGLTPQEWLRSLIEAHADLASELADSYTTAARSVLK
jgi:hypothetical protein